MFCFLACLAAADVPGAADGDTSADQPTAALPDWQALEFEQKSMWAVARSHLEILPVADDPLLWELQALNSVAENTEQISERFAAADGRVLTRSRLSRGKDQRLKTYQYGPDFVLRQRHEPGADTAAPADTWPVSVSKEVPYPDAGGTAAPFVTTPYILVLLAQRLQAQGDGKTLELLVNTDFNFYRVRLHSGQGEPIKVDYLKNGGERVRGKTTTSAVTLQATPAGTPQDKPDFSLFGLQGDISLYFDRKSGLLLQAAGEAPVIGATRINLKSVTLRDTAQ